VPAGAERGAQKMSSVGNAPPLGNPSAPVRSETWTDNLGRMGEERLAHVKELIEVGLGQRTPHFGQSSISLRHCDDHLVITWEANGDYGRAWTAWSDDRVRAARKAMQEKKQQALAADEKYRAAQSSEYAAKRTHSQQMKTREREEKEKSTKAWNEYYESQHTSEVKYEEEYDKADKGKKRLTYEIWLVFNINGGLPQNLPPPVAAKFSDLPKQPVNHFLRMQRSNYPDGEATGSPSEIRPPYPTDAAAAEAILDDIFLPKPRAHASSLSTLVRKYAKGLGRVLAALFVVMAAFALYVACDLWDTNAKLDAEKKVLAAIGDTNNRLKKLAGKEGQSIKDLEQAQKALDDTARDVEGRINYLDNRIDKLTSDLTLTLTRQGLDAAPCWGVGQAPDDRRVRYLFKVELREHDEKPFRVTRVRIDNPDEKILRGPFTEKSIKESYLTSFEQPAAGFLLNDWISATDFNRRVASPVNKVYAAQDADNSCRHYVRLCDHSYRDKNAASYKALLALVGGTFYYYRPSPGFCGQAQPPDETN